MPTEHCYPQEVEEEELDTLVRDLTKVGGLPKSEAKRRILEFVKKATEEEADKWLRYYVDELVKALNEYEINISQAKQEERSRLIGMLAEAESLGTAKEIRHLIKSKIITQPGEPHETI